MAHKILLVDDNPDDIEITRVALAELGREEELEAVRRGEEALARLRTAPDLPSLILLDLRTPGMSGIDTLRQIRADERLKNLPVVIVTASSSARDEQEAYAAGADGFLVKAFDMDQFGCDLDALLRCFLKY